MKRTCTILRCSKDPLPGMIYCMDHAIEMGVIPAESNDDLDVLNESHARFGFRCYTLEHGEPVPCPTLEVFTRWFEKNGKERAVAKDSVGNEVVSTVFLGIDHSCTRDGPPVLWETMVFGSDNEVVQRYTSLKDAKSGHKEVVKMLRRSS